MYILSQICLQYFLCGFLDILFTDSVQIIINIFRMLPVLSPGKPINGARLELKITRLIQFDIIESQVCRLIQRKLRLRIIVYQVAFAEGAKLFYICFDFVLIQIRRTIIRYKFRLFARPTGSD